MSEPATPPELADEAEGTMVFLPVPGARRGRAELYSLVLLAVGISHRVVRGAHGWRLEVAVADLDLARQHLQAFETENRQWPPPARPLVLEDGQGWWVLVPLILLFLFHGLTGPWTEAGPWFRQGAVDGRLVLERGEWWRVVTGLTLHADAGHLLGNLALGGLVLNYLAGRTGGGAAWFLVLVAASLGNYGNVVFHDTTHRFIGFSTAVFAAIGCLCGIRMFDERMLRPVLLPLGAGLGLLAMLGTEGVRTDVGAHLWGLGLGLIVGLVWQWRLAGRRLRSAAWQAGLGAGSLLLLVLCWVLALR